MGPGPQKVIIKWDRVITKLIKQCCTGERNLSQLSQTKHTISLGLTATVSWGGEIPHGITHLSATTWLTVKQRRRKAIPREMATSVLLRVLQRQRTNRMTTYCNGDIHYMVQTGQSNNKSSPYTGKGENPLGIQSLRLDISAFPTWCQRPGEFLESHGSSINLKGWVPASLKDRSRDSASAGNRDSKQKQPSSPPEPLCI